MIDSFLYYVDYISIIMLENKTTTLTMCAVLLIVCIGLMMFEIYQIGKQNGYNEFYDIMNDAERENSDECDK